MSWILLFSLGGFGLVVNGNWGFFSWAKRFRGRETFFNAAFGVCRLTHDGVPFVNRFVVPVPARRDENF